MKSSLITSTILFLLCAEASCSDQKTGVEKVLGTIVPNQTQKADTEFVRFKDFDKGEGQLDTAIATYELQGIKIELVSAVHIADLDYYNRLNKLFTTYDSLLYELIKPKNGAPPRMGRKNGGTSSMVSMFQRFLRDRLDLEFQLEAVNYRVKNFVHADLTAEAFTRLTEERGESLIQLMLKLALAQASGKSKAKTDPNMGLKMLAAFFMPDSARALKYLLAQQLQDLEALAAGLGEGKDGKGSVLLIERNKELMRVLHRRIARGDKKIGIFYGGAHLSDVEKRIFRELGFKRTGVRWEPAWIIKRKGKKKSSPKPETAEKKAATSTSKPSTAGKK